MEIIISNNYKISIELKINNNSKEILVLSHGLFSSKNEERFILLKKLLNEKKKNYLFFDYPSHGDNKKRVINFKEFKEVLLKILKKLREKGFEKVIFLGESLGSLIILSNLDFIKKNFRESIFVFVGPLLKNKIPYYLQRKEIIKVLEGETLEIANKYLINKETLKSIFEIEIKYPKEAYVFYGKRDFVININEIKRVIEKNNLNWKIVEINDDHVIKNNFEIVVRFILGLF